MHAVQRNACPGYAKPMRAEWNAVERVPTQCISDYGNKRPVSANQGYAGAE